MSAEGKSTVAPGPAAPAPSGHRAASLELAVFSARRPFAPKHRAQPSLPPPLRGGHCAISREANSWSFTTSNNLGCGYTVWETPGGGGGPTVIMTTNVSIQTRDCRREHGENRPRR